MVDINHKYNKLKSIVNELLEYLVIEGEENRIAREIDSGADDKGTIAQLLVETKDITLDQANALIWGDSEMEDYDDIDFI